jgi:hypothetical protein
MRPGIARYNAAMTISNIKETSVCLSSFMYTKFEGQKYGIFPRCQVDPPGLFPQHVGILAPEPSGSGKQPVQ